MNLFNSINQKHCKNLNIENKILISTFENEKDWNEWDNIYLKHI